MKKNRRKKKRKKIFLSLIFIAGLLIFIYPMISNLYYRQVFKDEVSDFIEARDELSPEEIERKLKLARDYNRVLDPSRLSDPYTREEEEGIAEYARMLEVHEKIGFIEIPKINQTLPVFAGTSETVLSHAAGHLEGTSLPVGGESTHSVITAHRGLPKAKLFRDLDKLKLGDKFYFHNVGGVLAYEVDRILTVEPSDFEPVLVVEGLDLMSLLSCTPYMINTHRLIVTGHRIPYVAPVDEKSIGPLDHISYRNLFIGAVILILILGYVAIKYYRDYKRLRDE